MGRNSGHSWETLHPLPGHHTHPHTVSPQRTPLIHPCKPSSLLSAGQSLLTSLERPHVTRLIVACFKSQLWHSPAV